MLFIVTYLYFIIINCFHQCHIFRFSLVHYNKLMSEVGFRVLVLFIQNVHRLGCCFPAGQS